MKRREFIQTSAFAAAGIAVAASCGKKSIVQTERAPSMASFANQIGIQLYTLRDVIGTDPSGILKQLSSFGYKQLETYGYKDGMQFGLTIEDFGKQVKDLGMQVVSGHYGMDIVRGDWERAVADAKSLNQSYMVVPWLGEADRANIKQVCEELNKAGEVTRQYGIRMGYHNHDFEFKEVEGKLMIDTMLEEVDPALVSMELDLYWVVFAGYDPLQYFAKYPGRFEQWHVKDMHKDDPKRNTEVGDGSIDYKAIFAQAGQSGMKHFYVEQETYERPTIESAKICIDNLKTMFSA